MKLNQLGLEVWKHKTNKRIFLEKPYEWIDKLSMIDETNDRNIIMEFKASAFDYSAWTPITIEEYTLVKTKYKEIYET